LVWAGLSLFLGAWLVLFGLWWDSPLFVILGLLSATVGCGQYWLTIRWVDRHGSWADVKR
jgi:hypothetical protein